MKISISWALSERIVRLSQECSVSVEERIRNLPRFELSQDGNVLACFPVVRRASDDEAEDGSDTDDVEVAFTAHDTNHGAEDDSDDEAEDDSDDEAEDESTYEIQDINLETARSLHQVLQLIAFHELKESSILIELAIWKSRIDGDRKRADCRVSVPDPAKKLTIEYCGFAGFLKPSIEESSESVLAVMI